MTVPSEPPGTAKRIHAVVGSMLVNNRIFVFQSHRGGDALAETGYRINSRIAAQPHDGDFAVAKHQRCQPAACSACPLINGHESHTVHPSIGKPFGSGRVPFPVPVNGLLALLNDLFEAPPLGETIVFLVLGDPIPVVSAAAIVLQRHLGRIEAEFSGYPVKHNLMGDACRSAVPETNDVAHIGERRLLGAADIGYAGAFIRPLKYRIPRSHHVPMAGGDGAILFGSYFAFNGAGFFAVEIELTFVVQQLHRFADPPGQDGGEADKQKGTSKMVYSAKPCALIGHGKRYLRPMG